MAAFDPVKVLENVINRLRQHDPSGFFDDPVTDKEAPNYSQVITHPMCFSTMREKVRNREYKTWGTFISDFELICANAVVYNQQKSKVHKAAKAMLRQGKIDLQDAELEGRKAIYLLHPGGPAQAANEEAEEYTAQAMSPPINAFLLCPGHTPLPPPHGDDEDEQQNYYSCYSDTDSEDPRGQGAPTVGDMEKFFKCMDRPVTWIPWSGGVGVSSSGPAKEEVCPEWWKRRRPMEWQCRWLELRLLELQSHRYRYARSSKNPRNVPSSSTGACENGHHRKQKKKVVRQQFPDLSSDKLLKHPFLGLRVGALKVDEVCGSVNEVCSEEDQKSTEEVTKYIEKEYRMEQEDLCFGAQVHVALGVLTEEMKKIMGLLQARRKMCQSHQKPPPPRPLKKAPSANPRKPIARLDSKRSRRDFEMEDMVTPVGLAQTTATVERLPKSDIAVPRVDTLSTEELSQRQRALDAWRPLLIADANTSTVPDEVMALVKDVDEGDSDEELTDQAFLLRHKDMESSEHERHVSVFGPPKKQKGGASGQRILQRSQSGPPQRDPGGRESAMNLNSYSVACLNDLNARGRLRGRRPIIGQRPRPPIQVQGGRRGGMSIGIPMMTHPVQANPSQPLQFYQPTSSANLLAPNPLLPSMTPLPTIGSFPATVMTSLPGIVLPYSSPMMPISSFSGPANSIPVLTAPMMTNPIPNYQNIQIPISTAQARMGVSATAGLPHPVRPAHLPPSVRPNGELGQCSIQVGTGRLGNGLSTNQSPGIVRGQPAVPMTGIVPQPPVDGAETDLDDELDVVESSPSQEQLIVAESITDSEVMPPLPMISAIQMPIQMTQPPTLVSTPVGPHPSISLPRQAALQPTGLPQGVQLREYDVQNARKTTDAICITPTPVPMPATPQITPSSGHGSSVVRAFDAVASIPMASWIMETTSATRTAQVSSSFNISQPAPLSLPPPVVLQPPAYTMPIISVPLTHPPLGASTNPWTLIPGIQLVQNTVTPSQGIVQGAAPKGPVTGGLTRLPSGVLEMVEKPKVSDG